MTTYYEKRIDRAVEEVAKDYAAFVNGEVEEYFGGYVVSSKWEFVLFRKEYMGTEVEYIPCRCYYPKYAVTARICAYIPGKGDEEVELVL